MPIAKVVAELEAEMRAELTAELEREMAALRAAFLQDRLDPERGGTRLRVPPALLA